MKAPTREKVAGKMTLGVTARVPHAFKHDKHCSMRHRLLSAESLIRNPTP